MSDIFSQASNQLHTIRDLWRFTISQFNEAKLFFGQGSDNAQDEAAYLILHTLNLPLDTLAPFLDAKLLPEEMTKVMALIKRRVLERMPVSYLTHQAWQGGFDFYVDERVLIPRSFIHELLGDPLSPWIEHPELVHQALDLCTGSACLAIQMAHHYPDAQIDAVDISLDALEVASINIEQYGLSDRIQLIHTDLCDGLEETYDLIISNPPYVNEESMDELPLEYQYEPELALESGSDGLDATRKILAQAASLLNPMGVLLVEIGHNQEVLEEAYPDLPFKWLETASGEGFVFLLTREDLVEAGLDSEE